MVGMEFDSWETESVLIICSWEFSGKTSGDGENWAGLDKIPMGITFSFGDSLGMEKSASGPRNSRGLLERADASIGRVNKQ